MHKYILALTLALAVNQAQASWLTDFGMALSKNSKVIRAFAVGALVSGLAVYLWQSKYVINPLKKENYDLKQKNEYLKKDNDGKENVITTMQRKSNENRFFSPALQGTLKVLDSAFPTTEILEEKKREAEEKKREAEETERQAEETERQAEETEREAEETEREAEETEREAEETEETDK